MQRRFSGLWRQPDFMRLWAGQTISEFGTWLGALSLLAILNLDATPAQMGTLETLKAAPAIVIGLFAGVWVDRLRRRPLLIAADWGRALMLGSVVLLAFLGGLHMTWLYVVAFLVGGLAVLFDVAYHAYIPALVKRQNLVEANGKLATSASLAEIASPGIGGVLVQV
ncbi:MAG: MFS transporter, partial [Candidatus Promineifilaceae bacterium]